MSIYNMLYDWQQKIVDEFKKRSSYGLFLKMGLGKTPISLAFAEQNKCEKVIVITINPKAIEDETVDGSFLWWAAKSSIPYRLQNKSSSYGFTNDPSILVINYEGLVSRVAKGGPKLQLKDNIRDFIDTCKDKNVAIIVDESHKIKNLQSKQTQAVNRIKRDLMFRASNVYTYLLTGTPFTTGYVDVYSQLKLLGYPETKGTFIDEFCVKGNLPGLLGWQQPIVGYKNVEQLFRLIHRYAITMESDYVANLPEQVFIDHTTSMSKDILMFVQEKATGSDIVDTYVRHGIPAGYSMYEAEPKKKFNNPFYRDIGYCIELGDGGNHGLTHLNTQWLAETPGAFWLRARQLSIGFQGNNESSFWFDRRRLNQLEFFLETNEDNYLLFYNYTPELLEIYDICERLGYNIDVYCGEVKSLRHYEAYSKMSESERLIHKKNVIIANFASGSTGMNWQLYNQCIIFSVPLFKDYEQAVARIHRLGQKKTTFYHRFFQNNWLDKGMMKALNDQQEYSSAMFESDLIRIQSMFSEELEES